ncbi:MAG: response regulator transcription factor [Acidimicrobiia bacterium]|nr:response regulator transcription factor [Acidimicrobiia bacterium]
MARIVVVEDDVRVREAVTRSLAALGHDIETVATGMAAVELVVGDPPHVVVLDLGLPDVDGREVLKMIRAVSDVPVIVATARDDEDEVVRVLDSGADDYVIKPYSAGQLDARVRAVLRRSQPSAGEVGPIVVGALFIDAGARVVRLDDEIVDLTRKEFDLLTYLAERVGTVVTKRELLAEVWRQPYGGADKTVDVHLSWLRKKLGESASQPVYLHTVRGVGVKLVDPT